MKNEKLTEKGLRKDLAYYTGEKGADRWFNAIYKPSNYRQEVYRKFVEYFTAEKLTEWHYLLLKTPFRSDELICLGNLQELYVALIEFLCRHLCIDRGYWPKVNKWSDEPNQSKNKSTRGSTSLCLCMDEQTNLSSTFLWNDCTCIGSKITFKSVITNAAHEIWHLQQGVEEHTWILAHLHNQAPEYFQNTTVETAPRGALYFLNYRAYVKVEPDDYLSYQYYCSQLVEVEARYFAELVCDYASYLRLHV